MASIRSKLSLYFKNLYLDYYEVFREVRKGARDRPLKATFYGVSTLFVLNSFRTNEGLRSYHSEVTCACNRIANLTENSRNPESLKFVSNVGELKCHGLLRQIDLGFSTIIYRSDSNPETALYRYNCSHLRPSFKEFVQERLVDLGFFGHWLLLELKMKDYDINENEYKNLLTSRDMVDSG